MIEFSDGTSFCFEPLPTNVEAGRFTTIATGVKFHSSGTHLAEVNHKAVFTHHYGQTDHPEPIVIGHDVWIGEGVRVLDGVKIGNGAIIGAGAVISKDVPDYAVVVGNPQQIKRIRFTATQIAALEKIAWWYWSPEEVKKRVDEMKDIDKFIEIYG